MNNRVTKNIPAAAAMLCLSSAMFSLDVTAAPVLSMSYSVPSDVAPLCVTLSVALSNSTPTIAYDPLAGTQFDITYPSGQFVVSGVTAGAGAASVNLCHVNGANWVDSSFVLQDAVLGNSLGSAVNVMTGSVSVATIAWGGDESGDNHAFPGLVDAVAKKYGAVSMTMDKCGNTVEMLPIRGEKNGDPGSSNT